MNIPFSISPKLVLGALAILLVIVLLFTSLFVVDQTENSVVLRFGKYVRTVGPGLQKKLPFGIEKNYNVETQVVKTMTFGYRALDPTGTALSGSISKNDEAMMLTGDLNIVNVEWIVQYRIKDPAAYLFSVEDKDSTIRDISQSVVNQLVGDLPILAVMTSERTGIEYNAQNEMQKLFDRYGFGVEVVTVKLQNIVPPVGEVQDAFEDVNKAIQDMNGLINEGKQYYNRAIPEAQGEASKMVLEAEGYAAERINRANGDTGRFNSMKKEYEKDPQITGRRLYIEMMNEVLPESNITVIDSSLDNFLPFKTVGGAL